MYEFAYKEIVDESSQAMRAQERRALGRVIGLLRAAAAAGAASRECVIALYQLRRLWAIFIEDLNSQDNGLPTGLRAGLISIGAWVNREIDRILTRASDDLTALIEINEIIRNGLN